MRNSRSQNYKLDIYMMITTHRCPWDQRLPFGNNRVMANLDCQLGKMTNHLGRSHNERLPRSGWHLMWACSCGLF